ncbi:MAG: phospholipase [Hyphomicrobiales bacterium]|nr:phospholipase [Hyphomicrobiales bacterium]
MAAATQRRDHDNLHDARRPQAAAPATPFEILKPGENCWRVATAERAAALVDGADYFSRLEEALCAARHSILILGWDFDHRIRLRPDDEASMTLGALLRDLVERRPLLEVRVLVWSVAVVHAPSQPVQLLLGAEWEKHPRISVRLDTFHPIYAAHHQKIVCVDDSIAFVGGMDLTVRRWDARPHAIAHPARKSPEGEPYRAIHDIQMAVDGEAAEAIAELARERWRTAIGEELQPCPRGHDVWPASLQPDFRREAIAIARTLPAIGDQRPATEVEALTRDCLLAARKSIYIEAQYMTACFIGDILADHLANSEGPDVVVLMTHESRGFAERMVMGKNRDRLIRRLKRADRWGRLRVCYPVIRSASGPSQVMVHSKLIVVDDRFIRIGSSNLNNRSMGLDTECDLAIEARSEQTREAITGITWRLLGEHLDATPREVAEAAARLGSMCAAIDAVNTGERGLDCFDALTTPGPERPVCGTSLLDPHRPFEPLWFLRRRHHRP